MFARWIGIPLVVCLVAVAATSQAKADLIGTLVTGSISFSGSSNFWNPATVTIGPQVEFSFQGAALHTADFTGDTLTISLVNGLGSANQVSEAMSFTDTAFAGGTFTEIVDNFPSGGLTESFSGDVLSLN